MFILVVLTSCLVLSSFAVSFSTRAPTSKPTAAPSLLPTIEPIYELFAVLNGTDCAETLMYGPSPITLSGSADGNSAYLCTNTNHKTQVHQEWLQVITSDGMNELLRIYWSFETPRTLEGHFVVAVSSGVKVYYRIVDPIANITHENVGLWRFSPSAGNMTRKFDVTQSTRGFSDLLAFWGAGTVSFNFGNTNYDDFWGLMQSSSGWSCNTVFQKWISVDSKVKTLNLWKNPKTYMYYSTGTLRPTATPSARPTYKPSLQPTYKPSPAPSSLSSDYLLFAVLSNTKCAHDLVCGPAAITTAGSSQGHAAYLSTNTTGKDLLHDEWLQITTTSDGSKELFRIYWKFETPRTLQGHFTTAVSIGEKVSYRVINQLFWSKNTLNYPGEKRYNATWFFSSGAGNLAAKFAAKTNVYFSDAFGVWGAGSGVLNGNVAGSSPQAARTFSGVGNWRPSVYYYTTQDKDNCMTAYVNGQDAYSSSIPFKTYMYYSTVINAPSVAPSAAPSIARTAKPTASPTSLPTPAPTRPTAVPTTARPSVSQYPTRKPTLAPTLVANNFVLFAVLNHTHCAGNLPYGPDLLTENDEWRAYLSTNTADKHREHVEWLQIVYIGGWEAMRIQWVFDTPRTLQNHLATAVASGVNVTYNLKWVVYATQNLLKYATYNGTWWFSKNAGDMAAKFATTTTKKGFSDFNGVWGAGTGIIDGAIEASDIGGNFDSIRFSGVGTWASPRNYQDSDACTYYYSEGVKSALWQRLTTRLYYSNSYLAPTAQPTVPPTKAPSAAPTVKPSAAPTPAPSAWPTKALSPPTRIVVDRDFELFAVLSSYVCAQDLPYGPAAITTAGSSQGHAAYLSTNTPFKHARHTQWLQIVTTGGIDSEEWFRINWTFDTPRTLEGHFTAAVSHGANVSYYVDDPTMDLFLNGTWRFSTQAGNMTTKFAVQTTTPGFSDAFGLWGAGQPKAYALEQDIDGAKLFTPYYNSFWGMGNTNVGGINSNADSYQCQLLREDGVQYSISDQMKVYMYYGTPSLRAPTALPSHSPSLTPIVTPTVQPTATPSTASPSTAAPSTINPSADPTTAPSLSPTPLPSAASSSTAPTTAPSDTPTAAPSDTPTISLSEAPSADPTATPSEAPTITPSEMPSVDPTAVLTNAPTVTPSAAPSPDPTTAPASTVFPTLVSTATPSEAPSTLTVKPSVAITSTPSEAPAADLTVHPSLQPTQQPVSVEPSARSTSSPVTVPTGFPLASPTNAPVALPTAQPITLPTELPTAPPTTQSTSLPTTLPTLPPTQAPAAAPSMISLQATQQVNGVSFTDYTANQAAFETVFKAAIAASITGISSGDIKSLQVSEVTSRRRLLSEVLTARPQHSAAVSSGDTDATAGSAADGSPTHLRVGAEHTATTAIALDYTISVPATSGATYSQMSAQLANSVSTNQFTTLLQQNAALQNVPALTSASSSTVGTKDTTTPSDSSGGNKSLLSTGAIVGIAIGGCAVLVLLALAIYVFFFKSASARKRQVVDHDGLALLQWQ